MVSSYRKITKHLNNKMAHSNSQTICLKPTGQQIFRILCSPKFYYSFRHWTRH